MGMTRDRALEVLVGKHREALSMAKNFRCACCVNILGKSEASHVGAYVSTNPVMKRLIPGQNLATYVVCLECARLPEEMMLVKVEQYLIGEGQIMRKDLKPLDAKGGHSPGHQHQHRTKKKNNQIFPGRG